MCTTGQGDRVQVRAAATLSRGFAVVWRKEKRESVSSAVASADAFHPRPAPPPSRQRVDIDVGSGGGSHTRRPPPDDPPAGARAPSRPIPSSTPLSSRTQPPATCLSAAARRAAHVGRARAFAAAARRGDYASRAAGGAAGGGGAAADVPIVPMVDTVCIAIWGWMGERLGTRVPARGLPWSVSPHPLGDIIVMALGVVDGILPRVHPYCSTQCQSRYGSPRGRPRVAATHPLALVREHTALQRLSVIGPCGNGCRSHQPRGLRAGPRRTGVAERSATGSAAQPRSYIGRDGYVRAASLHCASRSSRASLALAVHAAAPAPVRPHLPRASLSVPRTVRLRVNPDG